MRAFAYVLLAVVVATNLAIILDAIFSAYLDWRGGHR